MIFHENRLLINRPMKYYTFFFHKLRKMSQNLSSAAIVIGALRVKRFFILILIMLIVLVSSVGYVETAQRSNSTRAFAARID